MPLGLMYMGVIIRITFSWAWTNAHNHWIKCESRHFVKEVDKLDCIHKKGYDFYQDSWKMEQWGWGLPIISLTHCYTYFNKIFNNYILIYKILFYHISLECVTANTVNNTTCWSVSTASLSLCMAEGLQSIQLTELFNMLLSN